MGPQKTALEYAARSKEGIVAALRDARAARLHPPREEEHARRFVYGFVIPMTLLRIAWSDPATRRSMTRRLLPPVLCIAVATVIAVASTSGKSDDERPRRATVSITTPDGKTHDVARAHGKHDEDDEADEDNDDGADEDAVKIDLRKLGVPGPASSAPAMVSITPAPPSPPPPPPKGLSALRATVDVVTSRIVRVLAAIGIVEWILVWIGREHHDLIAYETSILTATRAEPLPRAPRLRFDMGWLLLKLWRAVRFLLFVAIVTPVAALAGEIPLVGAPLSVAIQAAWTAYWAAVFAIANTFVAWETDAPPAPPWFVRALRRLGAIPLVGFPARLAARILARVTRNVWPACAAFEEAPWESMGLAASRVVTSVPFLYVILRPMFGPAATHALCARRASEPLLSAATAAGAGEREDEIERRQGDADADRAP